MTVLVAAPYSYIQGEAIIATVMATNVIGNSGMGIANTGGILAQVPPAKPTGPPSKVSATKTSIKVVMPEVTGTDTGGSPITSYNLQYNGGGTSTTFVSLTGELPASTARTYTKSSLTAGVSYLFRYRVKTVNGWGPFSDSVSIKAATVPATPSPPTLALVNGKDVEVSWASPDDGASPITSFRVTFKGIDGTYAENTAECDASQSPVKDNKR